MTEPLEATTRRSRWIGVVWALPLAALVIVGFLGVRALATRGIEVVVTFDSAAGARVDDTKVIYQGVEAGSVEKIDINADGRRVDMTLRLDRRAEPGLNTNTQFWLVGAKPSFNDFSSVKAAVAGLSIGVAPGVGGTPTRHFDGLSEPPIVLPDAKGTAYVLTTQRLATARIGSSIYFRGQEIGKVTAVRFAAPSQFRIEVFVFAPYDRLVHPTSAFWISSPVQVALTDKGASANLEHAGALINGAVELDSFGTEDASTPRSPAGTEFTLYQGRGEAVAGPVGPQVPYAFTFVGLGGELSVGAPVRLLGFQVGEVSSVRLNIDPKTGSASTSVVAFLYPQKLQVAPPPSAASAASARSDAALWRGPTDAALNRLLAQGFRAQLVQKPPLIGGRIIVLERVAGAAAATLGGGEPRMVPSIDASGGFDEITGQVNQLLTKLNRVPIEAIGDEVRQAAARLNKLVASPQLASSLQRLDSTLTQVDQVMTEVRPQVGPLVAKLNRVADELSTTVEAARGMLTGEGLPGASQDASLPDAIRELTDTAKSVRVLVDYLKRHPESLIRGRGSDPGLETRKEGR